MFACNHRLEPHGRVRAAEVETLDPIEGVSPGRGDEHDEEGVLCDGVLGADTPTCRTTGVLERQISVARSA
jgi:hypothetical protein